jgi:hypothetical protein
VALIANGKNAPDAEGHSVLTLREVSAPVLPCEIEVLGNPAAAAEAASKFVGARVTRMEEKVLTVEVSGTAQAAALLTHLTSNGVLVVRFAPHGPGLEERYRRAFGGSES